MKKIIVVLLCIVTSYFVALKIHQNNCDAEYIYNDGYIDGIKYENQIYNDISLGPDYPYFLVCDDYEDDDRKVYLKSNDYTDYFPPIKYFCFFSEKYDEYDNFIIAEPYDSSLHVLHIKENFVYPTIENNEIDEVWMSLSSSYHIIKDKDMVEEIVECVKSGGEKEISKSTYDFLKEKSADKHCIWLKYKGYPLVEEFHLEETEDGKYTIGQYTAEEYETIYWQDEAHQW